MSVSLQSVLSLIIKCLPSFNKKKQTNPVQSKGISFASSNEDLKHHPILKKKVSLSQIQDHVQDVGWVRVLQHKKGDEVQAPVKDRVKLVSAQRITQPRLLPAKRPVPDKPLPDLPQTGQKKSPPVPARQRGPNVQVRRKSYEEDFKGERVVHEEKMGKYGKLEAPCINTILENQNIQQRKIDYFEELLFEKKLPQMYKAYTLTNYQRNPLKIAERIRAIPFRDPELKKECEEIADNLVYAHKMLMTLQEHEDNKTLWMPSPFIRKMIKEDKTDQIPSSPVNLHLETFTTDAKLVGTFTLARMGAIYDAKDPANTIQELRLFLEEGPESEALAAEIKMRKDLITKLKNNKWKNNDRKIDALKKSLKPLLLIQKGKLEEAEKFIGDKQRFTDDIMLQYVAAQLESQHEFLPEMEHGGMLLLTHLSLLNEKKSLLYGYEAAVHNSGLIMDEGRFIIEMADTFKRFKGKEIIFDGKGPLIDEEGNIHAAERHLKDNNKPKKLTIEPNFVNLTVQRDTNNNPIQRQINKENMESLSDELQLLLDESDASDAEEITQLQKELEAVQKQLEDDNKSDYEVACSYFPILLKITQFKHGNFLPVTGASCFSGKDRTQAVAGISLHRVGVMPAIQELQTDASKHKGLFRKYAKRVLYGNRDNSVGVGILYSNTRKTVFKIPTFFLPELSDISSLWRRTREYPKMIAL